MALEPVASSGQSRVASLGMLRQRLGFSPWLVVYFVVANTLDAVTTHIGLSMAGFREGNGIGAWILERAGEPGLYGFKTLSVAIVLAVVIGLSRRFPGIRKGMYIAVGIITLVVLLNILSLYLG